jgi:beta-lactamase class A
MTDLARRDALRVLSAQAVLTGLASWAAVASSPPPSKVTEFAGAPAAPASATSAPEPEGEPGVSAQPVQPAQPAAASDAFAGADALTAALGSVPRDAKVVFGIGVADARTGRRYVYDPSGPFEMASTVKVDLLTGVLVRAQRAGRDLTAAERARAATMIQVSDNAAADSLWGANGGAAGMRAIWGELGVG